MDSVTALELKRWNKILKLLGLGVDAGNPRLADGRRQLVYVGSGEDLERLASQISPDFGCGNGKRTRVRKTE